MPTPLTPSIDLAKRASSPAPTPATSLAGLGLDRAVRMTVYLTDLGHFGKVNEIMARYVTQPYPARAAVGVASLPRGALVEIDCILHAG